MRRLTSLLLALALFATSAPAQNLSTPVKNPKLTGAIDAHQVSNQLPVSIVPVVDPTPHVHEAIDSRIEGLTATTTTRNLYTTANDGTSTYVRNPDVWTAGIDLTAVAVYNSDGATEKSCTLISPRHIVFANHFPIGNGAAIRFVASDNTVVTRTLTSSVQIGATDIRVGILDSAVPATIRFAKLLPEPPDTDILALSRAPVLTIDKDRKALVQEIVTVAAGLISLKGTALDDTTREAFREELVVGDSGSPHLLILNGEAVLLGCAHTVLTAPELAANLSAINAAMTTLGGGYQATTVRLPTQLQAVRHGREMIVRSNTLSAAMSVIHVDGSTMTIGNGAYPFTAFGTLGPQVINTSETTDLMEFKSGEFQQLRLSIENDGSLLWADSAAATATRNALGASSGVWPITLGGTGAAKAPAWRVQFAGTNQSVASGAFELVKFDNEAEDTGTVISPWNGTSGARAVPDQAGLYCIGGTGNFFGLPDGCRMIVAIYKNGIEAGRIFDGKAGGAGNYSGSGSTLIRANGTTDYFEMFVYHESGTAESLEAQHFTCFWGFFVRP